MFFFLCEKLMERRVIVDSNGLFDPMVGVNKCMHDGKASFLQEQKNKNGPLGQSCARQATSAVDGKRVVLSRSKAPLHWRTHRTWNASWPSEDSRAASSR